MICAVSQLDSWQEAADEATEKVNAVKMFLATLKKVKQVITN